MTTNQSIIDISIKNKYQDCHLKCAYNFTYGNSNSTAKNHGICISLTYDNSSVPPVIYNNQKYTVSKINIYSPSLHFYDGKKANGEFIVEHVPVSGGDTLYVCIPIIQSNNSSTGSGIVSQIIQHVSTNAPSAGDSTNLNFVDFTLQDIIPKKPFFNYYNTSSGMEGEYIVYSFFDAISLSEQTMNTLTSIITPFPMDMLGDKLLYNPDGPNTHLAKQGIYISCQPTGSSEEKIDVATNKNETTYDLTTALNDPTIYFILKIIIGGILFIFIYLFLNFGFNFLFNRTKTPIAVT